ncbi:3-oxoacyl-ACP reductase family protein [Streptomyces nanhaiensis]|uniref:3-oxoacyl-ACP reductase family protein n=1 Tax=Streptomyces nanhaiensis TaxID=679319 RepID=UPI00399D1BE2
MPRTVLVTGGNRGIGLAIAREFLDRGDRVAVTYRNEPPTGEFTAVRCDVADMDQIDAAFTTVEAEIGPVEILVSNAGVTEDRPMIRMQEEHFSRVLDTNLTGGWRCARRALPKMLRGRWGRIVFVSSVAGLRGNPGQANYAASKAGMVGMARSMAREYATAGVTVNVVAPGLIETDMSASLPEARRAAHLAEIPAGRAGGAEEVAAAVAWLAGERAGYVTGAVIPVDGGLGMGH